MRVVDEDGGEAPLTAALPAGMVADALAVLAAADGDAEADTAAARAIVRAITADVLARLEGRRARVTVHDLVDAGRGGADRAPATSRSPRRSCCAARCRPTAARGRPCG